jgi:hypothetical protein
MWSQGVTSASRHGCPGAGAWSLASALDRSSWWTFAVAPPAGGVAVVLDLRPDDRVHLIRRGEHILELVEDHQAAGAALLMQSPRDRQAVQDALLTGRASVTCADLPTTPIPAWRRPTATGLGAPRQTMRQASGELLAVCRFDALCTAATGAKMPLQITPPDGQSQRLAHPRSMIAQPARLAGASGIRFGSGCRHGTTSIGATAPLRWLHWEPWLWDGPCSRRLTFSVSDP